MSTLLFVCLDFFFRILYVPCDKSSPSGEKKSMKVLAIVIMNQVLMFSFRTCENQTHCRDILAAVSIYLEPISARSYRQVMYTFRKL